MHRKYFSIYLLLILSSVSFAVDTNSTDSINYTITPSTEKGSFNLQVNIKEVDGVIPELCIFTDIDHLMSMRLKPDKREGTWRCHILLGGDGLKNETYTIQVLYSDTEIEIVKINNEFFK